VTTSAPHRIDFVIRDRDADAADDTISYQWSGVAGDPLMRIVGNRAAQPVIGSLAALQLAYDLTEDSSRIRAVRIRAHPQGSRASLMTATVRLVNQPAAP